MKRFTMMMVMLAVTAVATRAMSYHEARNRALFLADKMAYELDLTDEQYEAVYEINLDYLMGLDGRRTVYGPAWDWRNRELRRVLATLQYRAYAAADYFYRPVFWAHNRWNWLVYSRYDRGRFYRGRPVAFGIYRGGGRRWHAEPPRPMPRHGMDPGPRFDRHDGCPGPRGHHRPRPNWR